MQMLSRENPSYLGRELSWLWFGAKNKVRKLT